MPENSESNIKASRNELARQTLEIAKSDLSAARCLYENRLYPQAIFYLQQSVEKSFKSQIYFLGIANEKEARSRISHKTLQVFKKTTTEQDNLINNILKTLDENAQLREKLRKFVDLDDLSKSSGNAVKMIDRDLNSETYYKSLPKKRLKHYLITLDRIREEIREIQEVEQTLSLSDEDYERFKDDLKSYIQYFVEDDLARKEAMGQIDNQVTKAVFEQVIRTYQKTAIISGVAAAYYYLSKIFQWHATARYADGAESPLEVYTEDMPLIQEFIPYWEYITSLVDIWEECMSDLSHKCTEDS